MTLNLPQNREEILNRLRADLTSTLPELTDFSRNSFILALLIGFSGRFFDFAIQQELLINELFIDTATGDFLERWGSYKNISRNPATQATGRITATGVVASTVTAGDTINSAAGLQYTAQETKSIVTQVESITSITRVGSVATVTTSIDHIFASGIPVVIAGAVETEYNGTFEILVTASNEFTYIVTGTPSTPATGTITGTADIASVLFESVGFGDENNLLSGEELTFATPLAGIDNTVFVQFDGISGGFDIESDEDLRSRILEAYQNPIALFNVAQIVAQARLVSGVTRVFVEEATPDAGQVTIFFTRDNDVDIIPSAGEVTTVKNKILEIKPAHMDDDDVIVSAPTAITVNFEFSFLAPNVLTMQQAISDSLDQFFRESTTVGVPIKQFEYQSAIGNTVDPETGQKVDTFTLAFPVGDIPINVGEIGVLGTVDF